MTDFLPVSQTLKSARHGPAAAPDRARDAAQRLEATFLAEMLKSAGFGKSDGFAGGIGEEQFASFQRQAMADEMVKSGGLGLADTFYQSMMEARRDA
ncbi:rod-binding protein [Roseovarius sp. S4756]|uniref:rod-binding protein n=1 Tax=Roseovarius maritimus TaxID=3342637 RepID=UPI0037298377